MCVGAAVPVALVVLSLGPALAARPLGRFRLQPMSDPLAAMRHCSMELFSTAAAKADHPDDFTFDLTYALNEDRDSVSIRSKNYPDHYVQVVNGTGIEHNRLGLAVQPKNRTKASRELASFKVVGGLGDPAAMSFLSAATGEYIALNNKLAGACSANFTGTTASDITLQAKPTPEDATWRLQVPPM